MFTGIVEEVGTIRGTTSSSLTIEAQNILEGMKPGDSIAVNGVCLTVTVVQGDSFYVDVMPETIRRSNLGRLHYGDTVNLERALRADARFGGHFVQGHVDGVGTVVSLSPEEEAVIVRVSIPAEVARYVVSRGFIALDGVSLTVIDHDDFSLSVSLVTYTREHTTLGSKKPGDIVNLEVDIIAKYVEQLVRRNRPGLTMDFLEEHGFSRAR